MKNVIVFLLLSLNSLVYSQEKTRILFILDASNSMNLKWDEQTRMESAKEILNQSIQNLKGIPNLEIALRVYGHQSNVSNAHQDCNDTKLEVPFGTNNTEKIKQKIKTITAKGATPIARSLEAAAGDFPNEKSRNFIILITDGLESCDNDPCAVATKLKEKEVKVTPFVIGIGMDLSYLEQFNCIGAYTEAENKNSFKTVLSTIINKALLNTTVQVNLNDLSLNPTETNVSMFIYEAGTDRLLQTLTHTLNRYNNPDTLVWDPNIKYDIHVKTLPQIIKKNISITKHAHNKIQIDAAQGFLSLTSKRSPYNVNYTMRVSQNDNKTTINHQHLKSTEKYLIGKYNVEIFTLPRIYMEVEVKEKQTTTIDVPAAGTIDLTCKTPIVGQIFVLNESNNYDWVCNLNSRSNKQKWNLQPGKYKLVYRGAKQFSSSYTTEKIFTIKSNNTIYLTL